MKTAALAVLVLLFSPIAFGQEKPKVFIEAADSVVASSWLFGGSMSRVSRYSAIVSEWSKACPEVEITNSKDGADYDAQFPGDGVLLFDKNKKLVLSKSAKWNPEKKGIKVACAEIIKRAEKK